MKKAYAELKEGEFFAGTIHSHPTFSASQSGVDKNDEDGFDGIHLTFGLLGRANTIDIHERFVFAGVTYKNEKVSRCPDHQIKELDEIPDDWIKKVEAKVYSTGTKSTIRSIEEILKIYKTFSATKKKGQVKPLFEKQKETQKA